MLDFQNLQREGWSTLKLIQYHLVTDNWHRLSLKLRKLQNGILKQNGKFESVIGSWNKTNQPHILRAGQSTQQFQVLG